MGGKGLENSSDSQQNQQSGPPRSNSVATADTARALDPDLQAVVAAWPELTLGTQQAILALVASAKGNVEQSAGDAIGIDGPDAAAASVTQPAGANVHIDGPAPGHQAGGRRAGAKAPR